MLLTYIQIARNRELMPSDSEFRVFVPIPVGISCLTCISIEVSMEYENIV